MFKIPVASSGQQTTEVGRADINEANRRTLQQDQSTLGASSDNIRASTHARPMTPNRVTDTVIELTAIGLPANDLDESQSFGPSGDVVRYGTFSATPTQQEGPGGCCGSFSTSQLFKAGLTQAVSTALTFGLKPFVEASVISLFPAGAPYAQLTASLVGGAVVGLGHTAVSAAVTGLMNSALSVNTHQPMEGSHSLLGEVATIDLPVMVSFVSAYALRGVLGETSSVWSEAGTKSLASISAGAVQGMITNAMRQTMAEYETVYKEVPAKDLSGEKLDFVTQTFRDKLLPTDAKMAGLLIGKTVGSTGGMYFTQLIAGVGLGKAETAATAMATYLGSWFAGLHIGTEVGTAIHHAQSGDGQR